MELDSDEPDRKIEDDVIFLEDPEQPQVDEPENEDSVIEPVSGPILRLKQNERLERIIDSINPPELVSEGDEDDGEPSPSAKRQKKLPMFSVSLSDEEVEEEPGKKGERDPLSFGACAATQEEIEKEREAERAERAGAGKSSSSSAAPAAPTAPAVCTSPRPRKILRSRLRQTLLTAIKDKGPDILNQFILSRIGGNAEPENPDSDPNVHEIRLL
jgi:hypothetical protein